MRAADLLRFRPLSLDVGVPTSPLDTTLLKTHLGIDSEDFDDLLTLYQVAAVRWAENTMHRSIMARNHEWVISNFPLGINSRIRLPRGITQEVTSVSYSSDGNTIVMHGPSAGSPGSDYQEYADSDGSILMPLRGHCWPAVDSDVPAPVTIRFSAGWESAGDVPQDIKFALMFACSDMLELRGSTDLATLTAIAASGRTFETRDNLLGGYRLENFY